MMGHHVHPHTHTQHTYSIWWIQRTRQQWQPHTRIIPHKSFYFCTTWWLCLFPYIWFYLMILSLSSWCVCMCVCVFTWVWVVCVCNIFDVNHKCPFLFDLIFVWMSLCTGGGGRPPMGGGVGGNNMMGNNNNRPPGGLPHGNNMGPPGGNFRGGPRPPGQ